MRQIINNIKRFFIADPLRALFLLAFVLWYVAFHGFLTGKLSLSGDAVPYYEHFKFFVDSIGRGTYPMWDPTRDMGVPTEFFARRIGSYNPFFCLIFIFYKIGLPYTIVYMLFLMFYYFLGMLGFYLLAKLIFHNSNAALVSAILLMFSSLATILFDSFLMFQYTPIIWFFYFVIAFGQRPEKPFLLGIIFSLMLIVTTYLPFYFLSMVIGIGGCFIIFYFKTFCQFLQNCFLFVRKNKLFVFFCALLLAVSLLPGIFFQQEAKRGDIVMPIRHQKVESLNAVEVALQTYEEGGIIVPTLRNELFANLKDIRVGAFYIPFFVHILFLLGLVVPVNRLILTLSVFGCFFYLLGLYEATPLYKFFYEHVFYFKYMRNFQYFLWLVVLPVYILVCAQHFKCVTGLALPKGRQRAWWIVFISVIHVGFAVFIFLQQGMIVTGYLTVVLSYVIAICYTLDLFHENKFLLPAFCFIAIIIQPMEVYFYLNHNAPKHEGFYNYERPRRYLYLQNLVPYQQDIKKIVEIPKKDNEKSSKIAVELYNFWFGVRSSYFFIQRLEPVVWQKYLQTKFMVYDHIFSIPEKDPPLKLVERTIAENTNVAFVSSPEKNSSEKEEENQWMGEQAEIITQENKNFSVVGYEPNQVKLKVHFDARKFLVYNDSYYRGWKAYVNGQEVPIYKSNLAFKGIWVPAGENTIVFSFGAMWRKCFDVFMIGLFYGTFVYLIYLFRRFYKVKAV